MKYKKSLMAICLIICLFSIAGVCASDVNDTMIASEDQSDDLITIENQDIAQIIDEDILVESKEFNSLGNSENDNLIIDGNGTTSSSRMSISGNNVTLMNYNFEGLSISGDYLPGALSWSGNNGKIINCTFIRNSGSPGALLVTGVNCTVINCTFKDNKLNAIQFGGAVVWNGANGTIINSNFMGTRSNNEGGAIYWCSQNGKVINCTFSNNYAWRGGAIEFGDVYASRNANSKNAMIINSTFISNSDSQGGGAIYTWSGQNIIINNCTFIENSGSSIICSSGVKLINNSYFYKNTGTVGSSEEITNSLFYLNSGHVGAKNITNSIFLNNTAGKDDTNPYIRETSNLEFNWFGNTLEDYQITPNSGGILKNWLFLNTTHERLMLVGTEMDIQFILQSWDGISASDYDSSHMYPLMLNLSVTNGEIDRTSVFIGDTVLYNSSGVGNGTITTKFFDKELTINFTCKYPTEVIVNDSITIYVDQFMNFSGDEFNVKLIPSDAGNLTYSTDNETVINITDLGFKGIKEGIAKIIIDFKENSEYAPFKVFIPVNVTRYDSEIVVNNHITLNYSESKFIEASLIPNMGSLVYDSNNVNIATVNNQGLINTTGSGSTVIIVKYEGNRKYKPATKNITLTVNKIDSSLNITKNIVFNYDEVYSGSIISEGAINFNASVNNHPEANIIIKNNVLTVSNLDVGNYTLTVTTIPDKNHNVAYTAVNITVNKVDSEIDIPEIIFEYGSLASVNPIVNGVAGVIDVKVINHPEAIININNNMIEISNLAIGTYTLTVTTVPDNNHNSVTNTTSITVVKPDSSINFTKDIKFDYGSFDSTKVIFSGATGITNVKVINHPEASISIENDVITVSGLNEGVYALTATTVPDSNHNAVTATAKITVMKYDSSIYFTKDIKFDYGSRGSTSVVFDGATGITNVKVVNHPEAIIEIKDNMITVSGLDVGSYTLTATTVPTKICNAVTATAKITVNKIDSSIKFTKDIEFNYGSSNFNSLIMDGAFDMSIYVIGHPEAHIYTFENEITLSNLNAGNYEFSITTLPDKNHNSITINVPFKVKKATSKITIKKTNGYTTSSTLKAVIKDNEGNIIDEGIVNFVINGNSYKVAVHDGVAKKNIRLSKAKTYSYKATFSSDNYATKSASSKLVVKQSKAKISAKSSKNYKSDYATLKAIVKDSNGKLINEGTISFKINGKTYKVNVKKGVAQKKIKLSKVKTYKYKAIFTSKYYTSKTSNSKVVVKKDPIYTVKIGKYSIKISYKDYKKIKKAQKSGYFSKKYYTGKKTTYKVYKDKKVVLTKKKLWMDDTATTQKTYHSAWETPNGYDFSHYETKRGGGHVKTYMVYKKTIYKKVLVKTPKTKVYIYIDSTPWWGSSAQLYYLKTVYDGSYSYHFGNQKSIF